MTSFKEQLELQSLPSGSGRIFHGRGGLLKGYEHLCLDWYDPVLLLTSFRELSEQELAPLILTIKAFWTRVKGDCALNLVYQYRAANQTHSQILFGSVPEKQTVTENGLQFHVHLLRGQNHGLFLDMSHGRQWVRENAKDKKVLNLFSYTCGFSIAAMVGGASQVVNIDMSKGALSIGKQNHQLNGIASGVNFLSHDIFKSWGKLKKLGPYDMVIADPPSNQKGSFIATKDYARLLRRLPELLTDEAQLLLCLNAPELTTAFLKDQVNVASQDLKFVSRLPNPDVYQDIDAEKALKVLIYKYQRQLD